MTKPRLAKVRALFYVLQQVKKEAAPILTQPLFLHYFNIFFLIICQGQYFNYFCNINTLIRVQKLSHNPINNQNYGQTATQNVRSRHIYPLGG